MDTIVAQITGDELNDRKIFEKASEILREGGLVAFPTETVYGLGGNAMNAAASGKIYSAKGRPSDNPLIVHIADIDCLAGIVRSVPDSAKKLADAFWPGPLTMILKKKPCVPDETTGGLDTVAVRMPRHPAALKLIRTSGVLIAAPSANISGRPSPTKAKHVTEDLNGRIDMIIADDSVEIGLESTIIDLSVEVPTVLRPGYITLEMLRNILGTVEIDRPAADPEAADDTVIAKAPGMKYRHYAPRAQLIIVEGDREDVADRINLLAAEKLLQGLKVGIMTTDENIENYKNGEAVSLGLRSDEDSVARNLFDVLRYFDSYGADVIYSESFTNAGLGQAVMNRLAKAAGHNIIKV